nr:tetratricopeptide repeat protein [uncultured Actinomyces sp.]
MVDPVVATLVSVTVAFTKTLLHSTNNNLGAEIVGDTAEPLAAISQLVLGQKGSQKQVERAINRDLAKRMRNMHERCYREGIEPDRLANPCAEVEAVLNTIGDHKWMLEQAVHDPDALRTDFKKRALKQRAQVDERLVPYFDELIKAVVEQYIDYAERSPNYLHVAAKQSLKNDKESREADAKILDAVDDVRHMVGKFASSDSKPSRIFFGSRPDVVVGNRFVERDEQKQLNSLIADPTRRRTVLVGMRGCGKTQLAASLAQECEDANWSLVAWINASSPESIKSDLVELAKEYKIKTSDTPSPKVIVNRLFTRLKSAVHSDRLIVFDNVENIDDLRGLLPSGKGLRIVATTTNNAGWEHHDWKTIKVGVFDRSESIDYLLTVTNSTNHDAADTLARRLGDLPLALAQAAATAFNEDWTLTQYLRRLETHRSEQVIRSISGDEYPHDVYGALRMAIRGTLNNLDEGTRRAARRQLGALALLAESGVPTRWLDPTNEQQDDREVQDTNRAEDEAAHDALTELIHRSIVQQSADKATTMLHRLQAQVLRESWTEKERRDANESSTALLSRVTTNMACENNTDSCRQDTLDLIEQFHTISVQDYSRSLLDEEQVRCSLEDAFAFADDLQITYETLTLQKVVETLQDRLGSDHPDVLIAHDNLAGAFGAAGRFDDAVRLYKQVIASRSRIQGDTHPDTLKSRNNLACIYRDAGKIAEAMAEHKLILAACIIALDIDDPQTLASRNNLAAVYWLAGNLPKAKSMFKQVEADSTRVLGTDDSQTLIARNNLAGVYGDSGEYTRAIELFEQVIADRSRIHGDTHPETLKSRNNLACMYQKAGKATKALAEQKLILTACTQALGKDHPQTIAARNNLANAYRLAGNLPKAKSIFEQVEADSTHVLGTDHPYTLQSRNNLAGVYRLAGDYTEAINLFEQVIADRSRILGKNHPDTLTTRNNLAGAHRASGRLARAVNLYSQILNDCLQELHPHHPLTGVVRENLEAARRELEQQEEDSANEEREQED